MSDALKAMMYAKTEALLWKRCEIFKKIYADETNLLRYFEDEWIAKIGTRIMFCVLLPYFCISAYFFSVFAPKLLWFTILFYSSVL
jgi:hypothetical protein